MTKKKLYDPADWSEHRRLTPRGYKPNLREARRHVQTHHGGIGGITRSYGGETPEESTASVPNVADNPVGIHSTQLRSAHEDNGVCVLHWFNCML
jgi:hypothetical protein